MYDEQVLKLVAMKTDKAWLEALLHAGTEEERKAVGVFLTPNRASVDKALIEFDTAIKTYMAVNEKQRLSLDPETVLKAEKISKTLAVVELALQNILTKTKWPASSHIHDKLKQHAATLQAIMTTLLSVDKSGKYFDRSLEGDKLADRTAPTHVRPPEGVSLPETAVNMARGYLKHFEDAHASAIAQKVAYKKAKLTAKEAFAVYEQFMHKISPEYRAKKIDWEDENAFDKIADDPDLVHFLSMKGP